MRRPADADDFDGTVVVEWLNESGGLDPEGHGDLHHPGDADAYDIYTQVAADAAIAAGFVLEDDREALLADADPSVIPG